ncbi:MAG: transcriptional modulator of MazE/toxin, MazF [Tardiphaga sp.]|uniref:type II toxin-antitoxin system PemK/MazF family toxin n=1 Tax=Tardiphaga sp. TaxID=1926292 RepID=UPI002615B8EA|nr:type II toxin-antitoxin system PemK/MazF family toxin [Tardiphaga sp.]MDB5503624.1 transcriptional modulator of MazE/toxin, MazF [Tardiphaga sp.]
MKRGDLVTAVMQGAYGKPRPAVVIQATWAEGLDSVTFLPLTSEISIARTFRILVEPTPENGLQSRSQVMADKCATLPLAKIGKVFGRLAPDDLNRVDRAFAVFTGIA